MNMHAMQCIKRHNFVLEGAHPVRDGQVKIIGVMVFFSSLSLFLSEMMCSITIILIKKVTTTIDISKVV
jgi:hypothetical protein